MLSEGKNIIIPGLKRKNQSNIVKSANSSSLTVPQQRNSDALVPNLNVNYRGSANLKVPGVTTNLQSENLNYENSAKYKKEILNDHTKAYLDVYKVNQPKNYQEDLLREIQTGIINSPIVETKTTKQISTALITDEPELAKNDFIESNIDDKDFPNCGILKNTSLIEEITHSNNLYQVQQFDNENRECFFDFDEFLLDDTEESFDVTSNLIKKENSNFKEESSNFIHNEQLFSNTDQNFNEATMLNDDNTFIQTCDINFDEQVIFSTPLNDCFNLPTAYHGDEIIMKQDLELSSFLIEENNQSFTEYYKDDSSSPFSNENFEIFETMEPTSSNIHQNYNRFLDVPEEKSQTSDLYEQMINETIFNINVSNTSNNNSNNSNTNKVTENKTTTLSQGNEPANINMNSNKVSVKRQSRQNKKLKVDIIKGFDNCSTNISTPEITNDILELENSNNFDLLSFIESPVQQSSPENKGHFTIDEELFQINKEKLMLKRKYEDYNPPSCSTVSSLSPNPRKRPRGRPPKPLDVLPEIDTDNLNESDFKYQQMRNKNNLASRRSRMNRKDREHLIEKEANELDVEYRQLVKEERRLIKECAKWKNAVMKLAAK